MTYMLPRNNLGSENSDRLMSPNVWQGCDWAALVAGVKKGVYIFDDFLDIPHLVTPTITTQANLGNGWKAFGSSGGTILGTAGAEGGQWVLTETDDNEGIGLSKIVLPFKIIRTRGSFWWEARLKSNTITDTRNGFFAGLIDAATLSATVPIAAAGTLADQNFVGFHRLEGDGDQLDTVYKADGVTQVTVQADAAPSALVADTFFKIGMRYDHRDYSFHWFVNNLECGTTYTVPAAAGTDFPNDAFMGLVFAMLCASADDAILTLDWVRAAQLDDLEL